MSAKILFLDIETAPSQVYVWGLYDQNVGLNQVIKDGYMLSWSAKWLGDKRVMQDCLMNWPLFQKEPTNDRAITLTIWRLLDEADIVVAHNGINFDIKWLNALFLKHNMKPPSSYKVVDTLTEAKGIGRFLSNKLEFLVKKLDVGEKVKTEGFELWLACMAGSRKAWQIMMHYNKQDVVILEKLYLKLRPFMKKHPNVALYSDDVNKRNGCKGCGGNRFKITRFAYTETGKFHRFACLDCGKEGRDGVNLLTQEERKNIKRNIK